MKKKQTKELGSPAVIHGSSDKAQGDYFREIADATVSKFAGGTCGKGSKPRTNINSPAWRDGYDEINWGNKKL
jgi:hypothetical protein